MDLYTNEVYVEEFRLCFELSLRPPGVVAATDVITEPLKVSRRFELVKFSLGLIGLSNIWPIYVA